MHESRASTLTVIANVIGCGMSAMWPLMFAKTLCDEWGFATSCVIAIVAALSSLWIMTRIDNKELFSVIIIGYGVISMTAIYPMVIGSIIVNGIAGLAGINLMEYYKLEVNMTLSFLPLWGLLILCARSRQLSLSIM